MGNKSPKLFASHRGNSNAHFSDHAANHVSCSVQDVGRLLIPDFSLKGKKTLPFLKQNVTVLAEKGCLKGSFLFVFTLLFS